MTTPKRPSAPAPARPSIGNPIARAHADWKGGLEFEAGVGERRYRVDGNSKAAPSPVETLLVAVGTCAASDVVEILTKQRTPPERFTIDVLATRRAEFPRRVIALEVTFGIDHPKIDAAQAERAIALSIEKYCSVAASLAGDIDFTSVLVLNGAAHEPVRQPMFMTKS